MNTLFKSLTLAIMYLSVNMASFAACPANLTRTEINSQNALSNLLGDHISGSVVITLNNNPHPIISASFVNANQSLYSFMIEYNKTSIPLLSEDAKGCKYKTEWPWNDTKGHSGTAQVSIFITR